jgi:hypothetical protein
MSASPRPARVPLAIERPPAQDTPALVGLLERAVAALERQAAASAALADELRGWRRTRAMPPDEELALRGFLQAVHQAVGTEAWRAGVLLAHPPRSRTR